MQQQQMTEGPFGFPLTTRQAIALDQILKALPKDEAFQYRKCIVHKAPSEVLPGDRTDVSWISTETVDRVGDVLIAKGMNDSQYKLNPIVTLEHNYDMPPVGKSLWRKVSADGQRHGIKAKTHYPARPSDWPEAKDWPADIAFSLVQAGLLHGKSVGILPTRLHFPNQQELDILGRNTKTIIDEWLLVEYACTAIPIQQEAVVEIVSKGVQIPADFARILGIDLTAPARKPAVPPAAQSPFILNRFTPLEEIEKALTRRVQSIDIHSLADKAAQDALDRIRGRV